jgi:hypothetical protein
MPTSCSICANKPKASNNISFHVFPKEETRKQKWIDFCRETMKNENWQPKSKSTVCSAHFNNSFSRKCLNEAKSLNMANVLDRTGKFALGIFKIE